MSRFLCLQVQFNWCIHSGKKMIHVGQVGRENDCESRERKNKKVMEGREGMKAFDDTAGVYRAKWLCLSIQLKWIKGRNEWQTNLAPMATQFPQPDLLSLLCPPVLTSAPLLLPLLPFSRYWSLHIFPSPLHACVTVNLLFHKSHGAITLYCLWAPYKARQHLRARSSIPCKED